MALQMKDTKTTIKAMQDMGMVVRDYRGTEIFIQKFFKYLDSLDITNFKFSADEIIDKVPVEVDSTTFTIIRSFSLLEGLCKKRDPTFKYEDIFLKNIELLILTGQ
jgi:predicted unusual protein kinase regulating ubiquinone biosynthesis (AarF/ABC1/UbiB family)